MLSTTMQRSLAMSTLDFDVAVFSQSGFRDLAAAALDHTGKWQKRNRALDAFLVLSVVVFMTLHRQIGLQNVLKRVIDLMRGRVPDLSFKAVTPEAVCHARKRLGVDPLQVLFETMAAAIAPDPSFRGLRVWAYDGVRFTLPDTPANVRAFGRPKASRGKSAFPQMLAVALVDTQSHRVRDVVMGRCTDSERTLALEFPEHLGSSDLVLMDRGCSSAAQFEAFTKPGSHVLGRISASWKPRKIRQLRDGSYLVEISGNHEQRRITLQMRMIQYRVGRGKKCRLLTNLLNPKAFPALELARLYHKRWECELAYDELKTHLTTITHGTLHTVFRSKTPEGVRQEAYGTFIAYNLIRGLMVEAGRVHGVHPLDISFVDSIEVIKMAAPRIEGASRSIRGALINQLLEDIADCRNKRPRRHRSNPREVKVKMSNSPLKRRRGRGRIIDFSAAMQVTPPASPRKKAA